MKQGWSPTTDAALANYASRLSHRRDLQIDISLLATLRQEPLSSDPDLRRFQQGGRGVFPRGLEAFARASGDGVASYVRWTPVGPQRFLSGSGPLQAVHLLPPDLQPRVLEGLSVLAEANSDLSVPDFFLAVYGFAYGPTRHASTLKALLHRMRAAIGDLAVLTRSKGLVGLAVKTPFAVPDLPSPTSLDDQILGEVAGGVTSAKEIAARLGSSLRKVQQVLGVQVADGSCVSERIGNEVRYHLEDTTFSEPTRSRLERFQSGISLH